MPYRDINKTRECGRKQYYKNHEANKERRRDYYYRKRFESNGTHYSLKRQLMDLLGQTECIRCGFNDYRALVFDHIYGGGTKENENENHRHGIRIQYYLSHPIDAFAKIQVLCHNCNHIKRLENEEFRGWAWGYKNRFNYTRPANEIENIVKGIRDKKYRYNRSSTSVGNRELTNRRPSTS